MDSLSSIQPLITVDFFSIDCGTLKVFSWFPVPAIIWPKGSFVVDLYVAYQYGRQNSTWERRREGVDAHTAAES
jgi:hypothetical protein